MPKNIFIYFFIIVNALHWNLFAQSDVLNKTILADNDSSLSNENSHKKELSNNRFNLACGIGLSHGLTGFSLSYDFAQHWGADFAIGAARFPGTFSLRYNFFVDQYPMVISPRISCGTTNEPLFLNEAKEFKFNPAIGLGTEIRTYMNRFIHLNSIFGIEYELDDHLFPNTGICLGYTFGGENPDHHWKKDQLINSGGLACLNLLVGFFGTFVLPLMILSRNFSFTLNMLD